MNIETVVLCYPLAAEDLQKIETEFSPANVIVASQESIATDIFAADVFCGHAKVQPIDWERVVAAGKLRWIQSSAAGLDHCLTLPVIESDIAVSGCSALFANQVAEQTLAMLYGLMRRLPVFFAAERNREFIRRPTDDLHGKRVGIVGFGGNGRRIADLLKDVVGEIIATDVFPDFQPVPHVKILPSNQIDELFRQADVVIVTLPLNEQTSGLIDSSLFSLLKPGAYFINVARGKVVNQKDLVHAIENGQIGFAALDVVDPEPLPADSPLWEMENVMITPHVGAQSATRVRLTTELFCLNRSRILQGKTLINQVDKKTTIVPPKNRLAVNSAGEIRLPD